MVLSVVNLQEAYAKALLVDRAALARRAARRATCSAATRLLLDAYSTDVRPLCAAGPRRRSAQLPTRSARSSRAGGYAERRRRRALRPVRRPAQRSRRERRLTRHVATRRGPLARSRARYPNRSLHAGCCSRRTCSAATGAWPTSAAATPPRRAPPPTTSAARSAAMWVKGSGSDLATMRAADFTALRLDEVRAAVRARRDDRRGRWSPTSRAASSTPRRRAPRSRRCCTPSSPPRTCTTPIPTRSTPSPARRTARS